MADSDPEFGTPQPFDDRPETAKRLQLARERRGFSSAREAAERFGWNYYTYVQHENGLRGITREADRYAKAFRVSKAWLLTGEGEGSSTTVPIVGYAGAAPDSSVLFATGDGNFGEAPAPRGAKPTTVALEVRGDSMYGLANDGWLIYYDERTPFQEYYIGELCVCWLEDERVLVKFPHRGSQPGLYHLESANAPTIRDVPVRYFALVTDIKTRLAAKRWARENPSDLPMSKGTRTSVM